MDWISIAGGLGVLTLGAELLIRGSTEIARRAGVSELLIGLTLIGFGTSTPELVACVEAALVGSPGVAVGNVVGSNIVNILFILGMSALIAPFAVDRKSFARDGVVVLIATIAMIGVSMTGEFNRPAGWAFLAAIAGYIGYAYFTERRRPDTPKAELHATAGAKAAVGPKSLPLDFIFVCVGLVLLIVGAKFLVTGAINIAGRFGVSETIIGLTIVAIGTSLPELVTSIVAAIRGKSALALGNVVGSNIYNLFGILGVTAAIHPVKAPAEIVAFDNWVMLGATLLMILFVVTKSRLSRAEGAFMVAAYLAYVGVLIAKA
ncbi:MAG: calcium/sodium antiporter [Pseudomonadota bacterium]